MLRTSALALALLLASTASTAANPSGEHLFFIKRNKNANEVHYDARIEDCKFATPAVDSYWRDLADDPYEYEEIKWFESSAYGFGVKRASDSEITIRLNALPEQALVARLSDSSGGSGCSVQLRTEIDGQEADFRSVYVYARENFLGLPTVHYIDILGYSDDGQPIWERVPQTEWGGKQSDRPNPKLWETGAPTLGRGR